jgi:integrase
VVKFRAAPATDKKAKSQDLGDPVDILLATGCRIGEALALRWSEVDLDEHVVYLTRTVVREKSVRLFCRDTQRQEATQAPGARVRCDDARKALRRGGCYRPRPPGDPGAVWQATPPKLTSVSFA